jgi:hypothetical protein
MDVDRSGSFRMFPTKANYSKSNDAATDHRAMVNCLITGFLNFLGWDVSTASMKTGMIEMDDGL